MLQELPPELLSSISSYLSLESASALSLTCNHCYWAVLPVIYHDLSITKPEELFALSSRLSKNKLYAERASRYVRSLSIVDHSQRTLARYAVTSVLDHVLSGWELLEQQEEQETMMDEYYPEEETVDNERYSNKNMQKKKHHVQSMATILDNLFPRLVNLTMEFDQIAKGLRFGKRQQDIDVFSPTNTVIRFCGNLKLMNYRPCHPHHLYSLLFPFAKCTQLTLHTRPYLSLCAAIQDSLLMDQDIEALIRLDLKYLERLELAYVDDFLDVQKLCQLVKSLPNLNQLSLEWILPPSLDYYDELGKCLIQLSLYPGPMTRLKSTYSVLFQHHPSPSAHTDTVSPLLSSMRVY
ncbi:hypothetical protein BDA99DRAFT_531284 [Phascolomyces articulosus]|uniref:F-box domain-containing protein n=1 Tax=Phascolomyces articulosus TaxID=60185 RepID=A0AAD5PKU4_9FUNG|nr:hypothetical protein BDA99DRAFT_531284 [Phascolomyces articulosus]